MLNFLAIAVLQAPPKLLFESRVGSQAQMVRLSPDGMRLASLDGGGMFRVVDIASKKEQTSMALGDRVRAATFDSYNKTVISLHAPFKGNVEVPTLVTSYIGQPSRQKKVELTGRLTLPAHGGHLFQSDGKTTQVSVAATLQPMSTWPFAAEAISEARAGSLVVAKVGRSLLVMLPSGQLIKELPWHGTVKGLALDSVSNTVLAITEDNLLRWNYRTGKAQRITPSDSPSFTGAASISPNGKLGLIGGVHGRAYLVDLDSGKLLFLCGSSEMGSVYPTAAVDFSMDGTKIAVGFWTGEVKVWDISAYLLGNRH